VAHIPSGVKTDLNAAYRQRLSIGEKLKLSIRDHSQSQQLLARLHSKIPLAAPMSLIRMRMRYDG
jgi:hypothetical protein